MDRHRIGIVIPALNEAATIASVVSSVLEYGVPVVVDDGSRDRTAELAAAGGATVVSHSVNRGYDAALDSGFGRAAEIGCEYVITMDADGQHDSTILGKIIGALDAGADVVVGERDRRQRVAEHIFAWVSRARWGIKDPLCGMKGYKIAVYRELGHFDSYGSIGTELALFAARRKKSIVQFHMKTADRVGSPRFGSRMVANRRIMRALWYSIWPPRNAAPTGAR